MKQGTAMSGKLDLKNKQAREEWLKNLLKDAPEPYLDLPELRVKIYRYDFENGYSLIVTKSNYPLAWYANYDILPPHIDIGWSMCRYSFQGVVIWLTNHAKEI